MPFHLKQQKAFTIIELLVVIAIIAILTAIIASNFTGARAKSRDAKRVSDILQIQLAIELFFDRCNQYPAVSGTIPDLAAGNGSNGCPSGITLGTYISKIPTAPNTGESYYYGVNAAKTDYVLKAVLEGSSSVLTDVVHSNYTTFTPTVDCSAALAYCVQPR